MTLTDPPKPSIEAALAKARADDWYRLCSWQPDRRVYEVPSRSEPGVKYTVSWLPRPQAWVSQQAAAGRWWLLLTCSCPAQTSNKYALCWHKAAVWWLSRNPRRPSGIPHGAKRDEPKRLSDQECQEQHYGAWHIHSWFCRVCGTTRSPVYPLDGPPPPQVIGLPKLLQAALSGMAVWRDNEVPGSALYQDAALALACVNDALDACTAAIREWQVDQASGVQLPTGYHLTETGEVVEEEWRHTPEGWINSWTGELRTITDLDKVARP